jgi:Spy/CpxP family protein refolding chaperone
MGKKTLIWTGIIAIAGFLVAAAETVLQSAESSTISPYAAQLSSPVRGLSTQEVDDLLEGRGAGYARVAELNSYPGPRHILDLQQNLNLSSDQVRQIEGTFQPMQANAQHLGRKTVEREQQLSTAFARGEIDSAELKLQTEELSKLYSQLRATHLDAHLQVKPLLKPEQIAAYNELRGYTTTAEQSNPVQHLHHQ